MSFREELKKEILRARKVLQQDEKLSSFRIEITASGRVHDGEVLVSFNVWEDDYSAAIRGNDLDSCLHEFMRQHSWKKVHQPLYLSDFSEEPAPAGAVADTSVLAEMQKKSPQWPAVTLKDEMDDEILWERGKKPF